MSVSHETRARSQETQILHGVLGTSGGAAPLGDMTAAGAEGGSEDSAGQSEAWAAAVPPVRSSKQYRFLLLFFFSFCSIIVNTPTSKDDLSFKSVYYLGYRSGCPSSGVT